MQEVREEVECYYLFQYKNNYLHVYTLVCAILIIKDRKNILKMNEEVRMLLLPKKDLIQVE